MDRKMMERLKTFNKNFSKQKERANELGGYSEVPDGKYLCKVSNAEVKESNAGALHFVFQFEILESAEDESIVGTKVSKWSGIESEDGMAYLIRDLRRFGLEAESAEDLGKIADLLNKEKPEVKITLKSKDSGQFCYIDKVISEIDAGELAANEDSEDDSEEEESEEEESEEAEGDDVDIEVGTTVTFTSKKGDEVTGEVVAIDDKAGTVDIKAGTKSFKGIAVDRLSIPEMEEETEETEEEVEEEEETEEEEEMEVKVKPVATKVAPKKQEKQVAKKPAAKTAAKKNSKKK